jgi:hypothetical protein
VLSKTPKISDYPFYGDAPVSPPPVLLSYPYSPFLHFIHFLPFISIGYTAVSSVVLRRDEGKENKSIICEVTMRKISHIPNVYNINHENGRPDPRKLH